MPIPRFVPISVPPSPVSPGTTLPLETIKSALLQQVDVKTTRLIKQGFSFAGRVFSASISAQVKWAGAYAARDLLVYPLQVPDIEETLVNLADASEVAAAYAALVSHVQTHLAAGTVLKDSIKNAASKEELDAIMAAT